MATVSQNKTYRPTLGGSIGAGMGSVFNPSARRYYILEHRVTSQYHKAGETQEIIVDQIELGRDSRCQVRFDERFSTVSRRHAAIVRDGDGWKLVQLSKNNTTLLNGRPVHDEWYLQNGDEIQLSVNGPKLGFIVPTGKKATVGSIGLTRRLSLFRQQALRPYKQAIAAMAAVLVIAVGGLTTWNLLLHNQLKDNSELLANAVEENKKMSNRLMAQENMIDSLSKIKPKVITKERIIERIGGQGRPSTIISQPASDDLAEELAKLHPHIYHITADVYIKGEIFMQWVGTGFQLADGRFVTARHVTTPVYSNSFYIRDGVVQARTEDPVAIFRELLVNVMFQAGEATIKYTCKSVGGEFTFTYDQVHEEGKFDEIHTLEQPFSVSEKLTIPAGAPIRIGALGAVDFAYINRESNGGLTPNAALSSKLKQGTKLYILGYPHGWGEGGKPIYSEAVCAQDGLSSELGGTIMASNNNTEGGNSGGPIFVRTEKGMEVIGIVSGSNYQKGRFVPLSVMGQ